MQLPDHIQRQESSYSRYSVKSTWTPELLVHETIKHKEWNNEE